MEILNLNILKVISINLFKVLFITLVIISSFSCVIETEENGTRKTNPLTLDQVIKSNDSDKNTDISFRFIFGDNDVGGLILTFFKNKKYAFNYKILNSETEKVVKTIDFNGKYFIDEQYIVLEIDTKTEIELKNNFNKIDNSYNTYYVDNIFSNRSNMPIIISPTNIKIPKNNTVIFEFGFNLRE